jgi:transcriptional regulator with XRE-family HTH domain
MKQPNNIDKTIAKNLRHVRMARDMSLRDASSKIGIAYQQLQKYEMGINRVSAGRLWQLSVVYRHPVQKFYEIN